MTLASVGALYRRLMAGADRLPASLSVHVADEDASVQVYAQVLGDTAAIEAVWAVAALLDERGAPRAVVAESGRCHFEVRGRLGGLRVTVVTVLGRPDLDVAA